MNKLDFQTPNVALLHDPITDSKIGTVRRLIVLVAPNSETTPTRRIWELATATNSKVLLLGLCTDRSQEPALRRELVTLVALMQDAKVFLETKVEIGTNWLQAVKHNYRDGDMIVCITDQTTGIRRRPLSQILESNLKAPVYILGSLAPRDLSHANKGHEILAWIVSFAILVAALLLQIQIVSFFKDWVQTTLLILSALLEIAFIGGWNSLFG